MSADDPGVPHEHRFQEYTICTECGKTEAAIVGCHHCDEVTPGKRCWWCLRVRADDPGVGGGSLEQKALAEMHDLISAFDAMSDPELRPDLHARAQAVLEDCEEAGCAAFQGMEERIQALEAENRELRELVDMYRQLAPIRRGEEARERAEKAEGALFQIRQQIETLPVLQAPIGSGEIELPPQFKIEHVVRWSVVRDLLGVRPSREQT